MKEILKTVAILAMWAMTTAAGCKMTEPEDPKEKIPTGKYIQSDEFGFQLTVPSSVDFEEKSPASWTLYYAGLESEPLMEIDAYHDSFSVPSGWRKIGGSEVSGEPADIYDTPTDETKTVVSSGAGTLVFTGKNRTAKAMLNSVVFSP